eukprot:1601329-Pleurochrysis_carterae.AAC.4
MARAASTAAGASHLRLDAAQRPALSSVRLVHVVATLAALLLLLLLLRRLGRAWLQTEYLAQLLSRLDADGHLKATALDLTMLQSKTSEAQAEEFNNALRETAALLRDVGITETIEAAAHPQLRPGIDDERPGRCSAQGSSSCARRRRGQ